MKKADNEIKKKKKKHFFIKISIFFLILIVVLFISLPYIAIYSSPFLFKHFLSLDFKFEKAKYNPLKLNLLLAGITLSTLDNKKIVYIKQLYIDVNLKKTLLLNPTISTIHFDKILIFVTHTTNGYSLPIDINSSNKNNFKFSFSKFPFVIDEIKITDCNIISQSKTKNDNNKEISPITNLNIFIPGINSSNGMQKIHPRISGKYFGKEFDLVGTTVLEKDKMINNFKVILKNLDIKQIATLIPPIQGIQIKSGNLSTNLNVKFTTFANARPQLNLFGEVKVNRLRLYDTKTKTDFFSHITGKVKIKEYDVFKNKLNVDLVKVNSAKMNLTLVKQKKKKQIPFNLFVKKLIASESNITIIDTINNKKYNFINSSIQLTNFSLDKSSLFKFSTHSEHIENITASGKLNIKKGEYIFEEFSLINGDLKKNSLFSLLTKNILSFNIYKFEGTATFDRKNIWLNGKGDIKTFELNQIFALKDIFVDIKEIDIAKKTVKINSASLKDGYIKSSTKAIENIKFVLPKTKHSYDIVLSPQQGLITISKPILLENISGILSSKLSKFSFKSQSVLFNIKEIKYQGKHKININIDKSSIDINNIRIIHKNITFIKLKKMAIELSHYKSHPFILTINSLKINEPFVKLILDKNRRLQIFPKLLKSKNKNISLNIDLDKTQFSNGIIDFIDYSTEQPFVVNLSEINGFITHYPSTVYTQGEFSFSSKLNNRNKITLAGKIDKATGITGVFKTKYLSLPLFSPYMEKYLGYSINSGNLDINAPFQIYKKNLNSEINVNLKEPSLSKKQDNESKIDLSRILLLMTNSDGNILGLKIPIQGEYDNPDIDLRKIFFQGFAKIVSNFSKIVMKNFTQFKPDKTMEIIYFYPGSNNILSKKNIFSEKMLETFDDETKYYVISGFVDKIKDTPFIKDNIFKQKILSIADEIPKTGSNEEKKALIKLYKELMGTSFDNSLTNEQLKDEIKKHIIVRESDYYALSFARISKVRNILMEKYDVSQERIGLSEKSIFENPYISGIDNTIAIVISGKKY